MTERDDRRRFATFVALTGVTVGAIATGAAAFFGAGSCGPREVSPPIDFGPDCLQFVGRMAVRVGVATGVATILIVLVAAGLFRTVERMEENRRTAAIERAREDRARSESSP